MLCARKLANWGIDVEDSAEGSKITKKLGKVLNTLRSVIGYVIDPSRMM